MLIIVIVLKQVPRDLSVLDSVIHEPQIEVLKR